MKKIVLLCIMLMAFCVSAFAQGKQKVAVYMAGEEPSGALGSHRMVGGELVVELSKSPKYSAIDRTEDILSQLAQEHKFQRSGAVDDAQIKALGRQLGVQFLCIVRISEVRGGFYLEVRLVDVETAEVISPAAAASDLRDMNEMMTVAQYLARELVSGGSGTRYTQKAPPLGEDKAITPALSGSAGSVSPAASSTTNWYAPSTQSGAAATASDFEQTLLSGGIAILDSIQFATGKTEIHANSKDYLTTIAKKLSKYPKLKLEVGGHTDNTGRLETNMLLSQGRAEAVATFMVSASPTLHRGMLAPKGYGPTQPLAGNNTAAGREKNRRITLRVLNHEVLREYRR